LDVTVFIDESGSIPHEMDSNKFFVIAMLFTDNPDFLKKVYKRERMKIAKRKPELLAALKNDKEIKGAKISELDKTQIYRRTVDKCSEHLEVGIILLDLDRCHNNMRAKTARTFNYLIKRYLTTTFKTKSIFRKAKNIHLIIDNQNIVTESKYTLEDYLNTELNIEDQFTENDILVSYADSRSYLLLQFIDFIANTFYRHHQKKNAESKSNVEYLRTQLCNCKEYIFPISKHKNGHSKYENT